jgi:hypothetical protein
VGTIIVHVLLVLHVISSRGCRALPRSGTCARRIDRAPANGFSATKPVQNFIFKIIRISAAKFRQTDHIVNFHTFLIFGQNLTKIENHQFK